MGQLIKKPKKQSFINLEVFNLITILNVIKSQKN